MKTAWFAKDVNSAHEELIRQAKEPTVVKAVLEEINTLGGNVKKQYDELRKDHSFLTDLVNKHKTLFEKLPADIKEQVTKFTEAVSTRQNELDNQVQVAAKAAKAIEDKMNLVDAELKAKQDQLDKIQTALIRNIRGGGGGGGQDTETDDAKLLRHSCLVVRMKDDSGATWKRVEALGDINLDEYRSYLKAFETFVRDIGDGRNLSAGHMKSLSVGADPDGGFTVTPAMAAKIIAREYEMDPMRELCAVETITTGAIEWMVDWDQAGFGWEGETSAGAETTTPGWKKVRIPVHVLYAKPRATQTLLEDSGINVETWLSNHVAKRFARAEGAAFVSGDGVGKPRGFLTYGAYTTNLGPSEWGRIDQVNMGAAATLTADGFNRVKFALVEYYLSRGTWLMNRTTVAAAMLLKDGNGQYLWRPGLEAGISATLVGLPVRMSTSMPTIAANALAVALADWQEAYMIVDRLGITIQRDPFTAKPFVEFYTRKRVGGDVANFEAIKIGIVHV